MQVSFSEGDVIVKREKLEEDNYPKNPEVHYVQIRLPDDSKNEQKAWFNVIENDQVENTG